MTDAHLRFPSGRPLRACRNDAKQLSRDAGISLAEAQDRVALNNGATSGWSRAVQALRSTPTAPLLPPALKRSAMSAADVQFILESYPITRYGYGPSAHDVQASGSYQRALERGQADLLSSISECSKAFQYLIHVDKRKTTNSRVGTSYGLKHRAEEFLRRTPDAPSDAYVSNGALICAALHLGFEMHYWGSPNVTFNMSSRSSVFEWDRLKEKARTGNLSPTLFKRLNALEERFSMEKTGNPWEAWRSADRSD